MLKRRVLVAISVAVLIGVSLGYSQSTPHPQPGPEHQKLGSLVGTWMSEGTIDANPFGPAQKWQAKIVTEWFNGQFAVVRHAEGKGSVDGVNIALDVIAYDREAKTYTWYSIDSAGYTGISRSMSISNDVMVVVWEGKVKGKTYHTRGTLKGLGADKLTFVAEYSEDGKTWKPYFHSTDTRVKASD